MEEFISDKTGWYFILFIFIIFAVMYLLSLIIINSCNDEPTETKYLDPIDMRTGDILGISYSNIAGSFVSTFTKSIWSHTSVIWVDPYSKEPYVLEGVGYPEKNLQGAIRIKFNKWYNYNRRFVLGYKKYTGPDIDPYMFIDKYSRFENKIKLEGLNYSWLRFNMDKKYYEHETQKSYTCFEITVILLQDAGIYMKDKIHYSYHPKDIMGDNIPLNGNHTYDKTFRFFPPKILSGVLAMERKRFIR